MHITPHASHYLLKSYTHTSSWTMSAAGLLYSECTHIFSTSYIPSETTYEHTQFLHWATHMYLLLYVYYWRCIRTNYQRQHDLLCNTYAWHWRAYCWALLPLTDNMSKYIYPQTQESWSVVSHTYVRIILVFAPLEILISRNCGEERTKWLLRVLTLTGVRPTHTYDSWEFSYQCAPGTTVHCKQHIIM